MRARCAGCRRRHDPADYRLIRTGRVGNVERYKVRCTDIVALECGCRGIWQCCLCSGRDPTCYPHHLVRGRWRMYPGAMSRRCLSHRFDRAPEVCEPTEIDLEADRRLAIKSARRRRERDSNWRYASQRVLEPTFWSFQWEA